MATADAQGIIVKLEDDVANVVDEAETVLKDAVVQDGDSGSALAVLMTVDQWKQFQRRQNGRGILYKRNMPPSVNTVLEDLISFPPVALPVSDAASSLVPGAVPVAVILSVPDSVPLSSAVLVPDKLGQLKTWKEFKSFKNWKKKRELKRVQKRLKWKALHKRSSRKQSSMQADPASEVQVPDSEVQIQETQASVIDFQGPEAKVQLPKMDIQIPEVSVQVPETIFQVPAEVESMEVEI